MRTKAQDARYQEARAKHNKPPKPRRPRMTKPPTNEKKGIVPGAVLEEMVGSGRPSRKSTRKSSDHTKRTSNLQNRATMASRSPKARHARSAVRK